MKFESNLYTQHDLIRADLAALAEGEQPDHYRGFAAELEAERLGAPVYPVWDHLNIYATEVYKPSRSEQPV
jgi:hypothetical protein